jgi:phosphoribosylanthranilate isomerase
VFVKVCGLTTVDDVAVAVESRADAVGFLLTDSPRRVSVGQARELAAQVPPHVLTVGVFRGEPAGMVAALALAAGVRAVQLHGGYRRSDYRALGAHRLRLIRAANHAARPAGCGCPQAGGLRCGELGEDMLVVDSPTPGSGEPWDWHAVAARPSGRWMLAGGLNPDNVADAIGCLSPWGVDVSSGVEVSRGVKDPTRIRAFVAAAKSVRQ